MGCGSSGDKGGELGDGGSSSTPGETKKPSGEKRLLDHYTVGEMLGQGAFGIVYACKPNGSDRDCAVKMVDKIESPFEKIKEEAEMLKKMNHNNVIKCHDVIYERCFVCIVMDRLRGGDLIVGMQAHWKSKGKIPVTATVRVSRQMAQAISYLHGQNIVHRDVKGDNYLCDRADITDTNVRIVLTDFGTAVPCRPEDRLREKCGTKLYWSPEFYKLDYSLKVDIWAMGVVVYGLLNGKFPFRDEKDIQSKAVTVKGVPADCEAFVYLVLEKKEDKRADHKQAVEHPWIKADGSSAASKHEDDPDFKPAAEFKETVNHGVQDRRQELVERLQEQKKPGERDKKKPEEHYWKEWFSIVDRHAKNSTLKYEWWKPEQVEEAKILSLDGATKKVDGAAGKDDKAAEKVLETQLRDHGINVDMFGKGEAKTLAQFTAEVQNGSAVLMNDATKFKRLVRVVDVILLRICAPGGAKYLIETGEKFPDGRTRHINRLPGTKKEPHMNSKQMAEKICAELLDLGGAKVNFDYSNREIFEEEEGSASYPGVTTVYRKEIIEGTMVGDASKDYIGKTAKSPDDWSHKDKTGNTKYFKWMTDKECTSAKLKIRAPADGEEVSGLVQAPIGLEEDELKKYFETHSVDISAFGQGTAKSLKEISAELLKGESSLMLSTDGKVIRVVDVVVIKLIHSVTGSVLVQTLQTFPDGATQDLKRLPGAKRRPDENQFLTARRILKRQLKVEENHVTLDSQNVLVAEEEKESTAFPGLRTIYRKRIITATLAKDNA